MKNGGWKTGCALKKSKGIRGRVLEQIMEKIDGKNAEEVNQILENDIGNGAALQPPPSPLPPLPPLTKMELRGPHPLEYIGESRLSVG